jgi:hypothetical protein
MKVLIADQCSESGRAAVARAGVEVVYDPELSDAALRYAAAARKEPWTMPWLARCER